MLAYLHALVLSLILLHKQRLKIGVCNVVHIKERDYCPQPPITLTKRESKCWQLSKPGSELVSLGVHVCVCVSVRESLPHKVANAILLQWTGGSGPALADRIPHTHIG